MSIWSSTVSKNRFVRKITEFMTQITRTNFGLSSQPTVFNLNLSWFPSASVFNWVTDTIYTCCELCGNMRIIQNLTPTLSRKDIEKHIARAVFGQFLYCYKYLTNGTNIVDGYEAQEKLQELSTNRSIKVLTGTSEILKMMTVVNQTTTIKIPTISGTGNVKNQRTITAGNLIIQLDMSDKISDFISDMKSGPYGKYFHDTNNLSDVTRRNYEVDFKFLERLSEANLFTTNGKLELDYIKYDPEYTNTVPLLSYFGYKLSKSGKIFEYTMLDTNLSIFTIAACQIFNFIPKDKSEHGCTNTTIDLDYLRNKGYRINSKDFSNDILPKLYVVDEIDPNSLSTSKTDVFSNTTKSEDVKSFINHVPYLNSIHKSVISFIFCGLSLETELNPSDYNKGFNNPTPNFPKGPNKPNGQDGDDNKGKDKKLNPKPDRPDDSSSGKFEVTSPDVIIQDSTDQGPMDNLVLKQTSTGTFGLFRSIGGLAVKGVSILAPNVGTALTIGEKALNLYYQSKPKPNILVDNRSLIGQMNNEFSVVPSVPLIRGKR